MAENRQMVAVVAAILNEQNQLFLTKRNNPGEPALHETWVLPGGKIEFGEDPLQAVIRETKEETGFDIEVEGLFPEAWSNMFGPNSSHPDSSMQVILIGYKCKIIGGEFKPNPREVLDGGFFTRDQVDPQRCIMPVLQVFELISK